MTVCEENLIDTYGRKCQGGWKMFEGDRNGKKAMERERERKKEWNRMIKRRMERETIKWIGMELMKREGKGMEENEGASKDGIGNREKGKMKNNKDRRSR